MRRKFMNRRFLTFVVLFAIAVPLSAVAQVAWVKDFGDALKQASKEKKFVVLDMSASW
jgi:hypothetical protein